MIIYGEHTKTINSQKCLITEINAYGWVFRRSQFIDKKPETKLSTSKEKTL